MTQIFNNRIADHHGDYVKGLYYTPPAPPPAEIVGKWEVVFDDDRVMVRVRWSLPTEDGAMFYCRHYPGTNWGVHACVREAERWNEGADTPYSVSHIEYATKVPLTLTADEYRVRMARRAAANAKTQRGEVA